MMTSPALALDVNMASKMSLYQDRELRTCTQSISIATWRDLLLFIFIQVREKNVLLNGLLKGSHGLVVLGDDLS